LDGDVVKLGSEIGEGGKHFAEEKDQQKKSSLGRRGRLIWLQTQGERKGKR